MPGGAMSLFMTMIASPHYRQRMRAPFPLIRDSSSLKRALQAWHSMIIMFRQPLLGFLGVSTPNIVNSRGALNPDLLSCGAWLQERTG